VIGLEEMPDFDDGWFGFSHVLNSDSTSFMQLLGRMTLILNC
jgi:hypothetical protein